MNLRTLVYPLVAVAVLGAVGVAGYRTRDRWWPHVFPAKPDAKSGGYGAETPDPHAGHDHAHDHGDRVKPSPQAQKNLALDVDKPTPQDYRRTLPIPGAVVDRPGESDRPDRPREDRQEVDFAVAKRDRVANLVRQGTQPESALTEEENQIKRLTTQVQAYRRQLQVFGLAPTR